MAATRESWVVAGLQALAEGGVEAVAVEPVSRKLGVTKGSFYWHFENRGALLEAVLALWEQRSTTDIIVALSELSDPAERLRQLLRRAAVAARGSPSHSALSSSREPSVRRVIRRVTDARLAFVAACYAELGMPRGEARRRAFLAYAAYLGMVQLAEDAPAEMSTRAQREAYARHVIETLVPAAPAR